MKDALIDWSKVPPWFAVVVILSGGYGTQFIRPDKFGADDAKELEAKIIRNIDYKIKDLRYTSPPIKTRQRIANIERFLSAQYSKSQTRNYDRDSPEAHLERGVFESEIIGWGD